MATLLYRYNNHFNIAMLFMVLAPLVGPLYSLGCSSTSCGQSYTVGDSLWSIPPSLNFYTNWSSSHFFKIGDSLVFDYEIGRYNVIQVTKQEYENCIVCNPLKTFFNGSSSFLLNKKGVFYFLCNVSNYCSLGLKVLIVVHECSLESPTPSPSPSSSPSPSPSRVTVAPPAYHSSPYGPPVPSSRPTPIPMRSPSGNNNTPKTPLSHKSGSSRVMFGSDSIAGILYVLASLLSLVVYLNFE